jgi:DNA-directed RNA polymerase subunit RPC12/RpoP
LNCLAAVAYFLPQSEDAVELGYIHNKPCPHCGGKLVFKAAVESPTTGSLVGIFRCEDCGHVHSVERRSA